MHSELIDKCATFIEEKYIEQVIDQVESDEIEVIISWKDLYKYDMDMAQDLIDNPEEIINHFEAGLKEVNLPPAVEGAYSVDLKEIKPIIRFTDLETERVNINSLRHQDVGKFISLNSQVDTRTQVEPQIENAVFECQCGELIEIPQVGDEIQQPHQCPKCEYKGDFLINDAKSDYQDHQLIQISDPPEVTTGKADTMTIETYGSLAGMVEAGDRVNVVGTLETKAAVDETSPNRRRPLKITANNIELSDRSFDDLDTDRVDEIKTLAKSDDLYTKLIDSIAPHILTDERGDAIKLSLVLQLFGGVERNLDSGYKRGNINILLIGTPGTAKSQYLRAVNEIAPKGIFVSGKNARPAGMTATATRSEHTGEWTLKAGALVKASGGVACIDEFDKMQNETKSSLHEALEDQRISVAKADINTTLPAKTSVLGAANPDNGIFRREVALSEQIDIGPTILSRFDLIFGIEQTVNEEWDRSVAKHQHNAADPDEDDPKPAIETDLLTEYIAYARQKIEPSFASEEVKEKLVEFYVDLRQESVNADKDDVRPVGPRINELLRRLAQASARARLSNEITLDDVDRVIELFKQTIGEIGLDSDGTINGNKLDGGYQKTYSQDERRNKILEVLEENGEMGQNELIEECANQGLDGGKVKQMLEKWKNSSKSPVYIPPNGKVGLA